MKPFMIHDGLLSVALSNGDTAWVPLHQISRVVLRPKQDWRNLAEVVVYVGNSSELIVYFDTTEEAETAMHPLLGAIAS